LHYPLGMMLEEQRVDRRMEPRVKTEGTLDVVVRAGDESVDGRVVDISTRGAYIETELVLDRGIYVSLVFRLPGPRGDQEIKAQVARSSPSSDPKASPLPRGLGVMFLTNAPGQQARVERLVAALVSADLLSYDERPSERMDASNTIQGAPTTTPSNTDTRPGA